MKAINKFTCILTFFVATNACHAKSSTCTTQPAEDLHAPVSLDKNVAIRFVMAKVPVDPHGDIFPITIVAQQCDSGNITKIAELPYLGDPGKIESAFLADSDFDGTAELFVIHRTTLYSDTGISYSSDYFTIMTYKRLTPLKYEVSERIRAYFGAGGDISNSPTNKELTYEYPYKSEEAIKKQIESTKYRDWYEKKITTTRTLRKTHLHSQANTTDKTSRYLIAGDKVLILNQEAGWLEVIFHNNKKGDIKGWIPCKDTLECANQTPPHTEKQISRPNQ